MTKAESDEENSYVDVNVKYFTEPTENKMELLQPKRKANSLTNLDVIPDDFAYAEILCFTEVSNLCTFFLTLFFIADSLQFRLRSKSINDTGIAFEGMVGRSVFSSIF